MSRYIDADLLWDEIQHMPFYNNADKDSVEDLILSIHTAEVREVKRGKWIKKQDDVCYWTACSECGNKTPYDRWHQGWESPFCPNCGADMRGEEE